MAKIIKCLLEKNHSKKKEFETEFNDDEFAEEDDRRYVLANNDENNEDNDMAEEFLKRIAASANCVRCGFLRKYCCNPDKCKQRALWNKCVKYVN